MLAQVDLALRLVPRDAHPYKVRLTRSTVKPVIRIRNLPFHPSEAPDRIQVDAVSRGKRGVFAESIPPPSEVKRAVEFQITPVGVEVPHRVEEIVAWVRALATRSGLAPCVAEAAIVP